MLSPRVLPDFIASLGFIEKIRILAGSIFLKTVRLGLILIIIAAARYEPGDNLSLLGFLFVNALVIETILQSFTMNEIVNAGEFAIHKESERLFKSSTVTKDDFEKFWGWARNVRHNAIRLAVRASFFITLIIGCLYFLSFSGLAFMSLAIAAAAYWFVRTWFMARSNELNVELSPVKKSISAKHPLRSWVTRSHQIDFEEETQRRQLETRLFLRYFILASALGLLFLGAVTLFNPIIFGVEANEASATVSVALMLWCLYSGALSFNTDNLANRVVGRKGHSNWTLTAPPPRSQSEWNAIHIVVAAISEVKTKKPLEIDIKKGEIIQIVAEMPASDKLFYPKGDTASVSIEIISQAGPILESSELFLRKRATIIGPHIDLTDFEIDPHLKHQWDSLIEVLSPIKLGNLSASFSGIEQLQDTEQKKILLSLAIFEGREILIIDQIFGQKNQPERVDFSPIICDYLRGKGFTTIIISNVRLDRSAFDRVYVLR